MSSPGNIRYEGGTYRWIAWPVYVENVDGGVN